MKDNDFSTLDHVVLDFTKLTIELHGDDGEYVEDVCPRTKTGYEQFQRMVEFCQNNLPPEQRIYKL